MAGRWSAFMATRWPELLTGIVILESIAAATLENHFGLKGGIPWGAYYAVWLAMAFVVGLIAFFVWLIPHSITELPSSLRAVRRRQYVEMIVPIVVLPAFLASHTTFKALIPHFTSYWTDPPLAQLDEMFGFVPWQLTHALFGPITWLIDLIYLSWFFVTTGLLFAVLFIPRFASARGQVLLTFVVSWIVLGAALAVAVPSVGPCFYDQVYGSDRFAGLMAELHRHGELNALLAQDKLWADHLNDTVGFGSGLSAMPSMHVSVAVLTWLFLRQYGLGWIGCVWVAAIFVGSVHLGWHYASDGLVAGVITWFLWRVFDLPSASKLKALPRDAATAVPLVS